MIRFWNYLTQECLYTINEYRPSEQTLGVAVNCTEDKIITHGADSIIYVYDVKTKARLMQLSHRSAPFTADTLNYITLKIF